MPRLSVMSIRSLPRSKPRASIDHRGMHASMSSWEDSAKGTKCSWTVWIVFGFAIFSHLVTLKAFGNDEVSADDRICSKKYLKRTITKYKGSTLNVTSIIISSRSLCEIISACNQNGYTNVIRMDWKLVLWLYFLVICLVKISIGSLHVSGWPRGLLSACVCGYLECYEESHKEGDRASVGNEYRGIRKARNTGVFSPSRSS